MKTYEISKDYELLADLLESGAGETADFPLTAEEIYRCKKRWEVESWATYCM